MKYTASYLTLSHLFHTIGRLSEKAKKNFSHLKCTDSSSFNHKSFSFQKCSKENSQSNPSINYDQICLFFYELSQFISHVFAWNVCGLSLSILRCDLCLTNRFYLVILKKLTDSISISGRLRQETTDISG